MKTVLKTLLLLTLATVIAAPAAAQEKKRGRRKKGPQEPRTIAAIKTELAKVQLTKEQSEKVDALFKEYSPKLAEAQKKLSELVTPEQRNAMMDARKKANAEGKKGKESQAAADAALNLPEEKLAAWKKAQGASRDLNSALRKAVLAVLTPEQQKQVSLRQRGQRGERQKAKRGGRKGKKARGADSQG